ncbi:MAG: putative porin [Verrucomicrobia bacterium]|nr:putative porin [Verrucomicrobiota bacterium]
MKRITMTLAAVLAALSVRAADPTITDLQAQLSELSAKIAQLELQAAQKTAAPVDVTARLDKLEAKPSVPQWALDTKIKGDFRYRYENVDRDGTPYKDRQRVRLRVGAYGKVNDYVDYGIRLATGGASATSANQDVDGGTKKEIMLDQYYVDLHPEMFMGAHLIMGKMPQPWQNRTGLIWDGDLNPEGIALTYETTFSNGVKLIANAGSFVLKEDQGDDLQLWAGQIVGETKVGDATVRLGVSDFYYQNVDAKGAGLTTTGANTPGTEFNLVEVFGKVSSKIGDLPVAVNGQYVQNIAAASGDDTAYLLGFSLGKAKAVGSWEAGYNYRDTGADAVPDGYNDSDFAYGSTGSHGHSFWAKYQIAKNLQGGATYLMAQNDSGTDVNTMQLDLNFKF